MVLRISSSLAKGQTRLFAWSFVYEPNFARVELGHDGYGRSGLEQDPLAQLRTPCPTPASAAAGAKRGLIENGTLKLA
jgi:hypothetical protein